ncbi:hypothetical protein ACHAWF_008758 [Thalassiosira exigua]
MDLPPPQNPPAHRFDNRIEIRRAEHLPRRPKSFPVTHFPGTQLAARASTPAASPYQGRESPGQTRSERDRGLPLSPRTESGGIPGPLHVADTCGQVVQGHPGGAPHQHTEEGGRRVSEDSGHR